MELLEVKNYLRVDFEEDDADILLMMEAAQEYIKDAIGFYDDTSARQKLLFLTLVSSMYENRQYTIDSSNEKVAYALHSMMFQLQLGEGDLSE